MSLRGVVENLEETPSSQLRAFWRETLCAVATMSVPASTLVAKYLSDTPPIRMPEEEEEEEKLVRFRIVEAIEFGSEGLGVDSIKLGLLHSVDIRFRFFVKINDVSCLFTLLFIILGLK